MIDLQKQQYIEIKFCKKVEKHLHEIGIAKPYYLSYRLPETYEYNGKKYKIMDCVDSVNKTVNEVWKPALFGKIFGTFLFFCYPFAYIFKDFLYENQPFLNAMGTRWFCLLFVAFMSWGIFWNVPSNDEDNNQDNKDNKE